MNPPERRMLDLHRWAQWVAGADDMADYASAQYQADAIAEAQAGTLEAPDVDAAGTYIDGNRND